MTIRQVYTITNNQLIINLPAGFSKSKKVLVIVDDKIDPIEEKMLLMKKAANDPLYLNDLKEVGEDFDAIDIE